MVRHVRVEIDDDEFDRMNNAKGDRTWLDMLRAGFENDPTEDEEDEE